MFLRDLRFYKKLLTHDYEICGNFDNINGDLVVNKALCQKGYAIKGRTACHWKIISQYIWHTHPNNAKSYPSAEDVLKILKNPVIKISIIFTKWGIWILKCDKYFEILNNSSTYNHHLYRINEFGDNIYYATLRGRKNKLSRHDINVINKYIINLQNRYESLYITFIPWDKATTQIRI